jgi:choline dehydrogenase-like flavoprotein/predicted acylesterase/phospholipase RssA
MSSQIVSKAQNPGTTPFDFIIVGSGAGGGPLAARLALAGKRVLVIEAGDDPAAFASRDFPDAAIGEVHDIPGYHAAATEDKEMSWQFSVRHFKNDANQKKDDKYNRLNAKVDGTAYPPDSRFLDGGVPGRKGGIFYPRSSGIGGCTAHHAMIVVAPNDKDWDYIADLTGDDSWRAAQMRGYFAKLEQCLYLDAYNEWFRSLLGVLYKLWRWLVLLFQPRAVLDEGGHGRKGWQQTSFLDPNLIEKIADTDKSFLQVLSRAALSVLHRDRKLIALIKDVLFRFRLVAHIDPNDQNTRRVTPEGVFLIPTGIAGGVEKSGATKVMKGRRQGVREFLLDTRDQLRREHPDDPDRLVILTGYHVTRVIFESSTLAPKAIGVEAAQGKHLYEASPMMKKAEAPAGRVQFFTRGEVILSGGAFNTPQLLMLSGIGDEKHLQEKTVGGLPGPDGKIIAPIVHLPGVGCNLQDRYEVSVISELDHEFKILDGITFTPGDAKDPGRTQWCDKRTGLYAGNGGTLALMKRSAALDKEPEPDLFIFGAPAAFRGYYWGWSRELLRSAQGVHGDVRKLWSWVILKAYTQNKNGSVRLHTNNPFEQPEICFDSFNESAELEATRLKAQIHTITSQGKSIPSDLQNAWNQNETVLVNSRNDLKGLVDAVKTIRAINACNPSQFVREIQPGQSLPDDSSPLEEWIKTQAWGHHASCTCRIGADDWQPKPENLLDKQAALDSRFRVHGVKNLRVVDASVFPRIPGYFILAPTLMISEKAADVIIADAAAYPRELCEAEMKAIAARREIARVSADENQRPATVGLALSGGGIRSATFAVGVLQALAGKGRLREIDYLSTVSGGGFTGSFLGRLFTRPTVTQAADPVDRVQSILRDPRSAPLAWLRSQANYLLGSGRVDLRQNLAVYFRNVFTVHLVIGALLFAVFGLLRGLSAYEPAIFQPPIISIGANPLALSAWWWLPVLIAALGILPGAFGYWLAPKVRSPRPHPFFSVAAWLVVVGASVLALRLPGGLRYAPAGLVVLTVTWVWQEAARWGYQQDTGDEGTVIRNRLTRSLGEVLALFVLALAWVALDTVARYAAQGRFVARLSVILLALGPALPLLRKLAEFARRYFGGSEKASAGGKGRLAPILMMIAITFISLALGAFLLFLVDFFAHRVFDYSAVWGWSVVAIAFLFSLVVGRALEFLNNSSLLASYAARVTHTFQGASNDARIYTSTRSKSHDVQLVDPKDDLCFHEYHPEQHGGPLHLINVCVNETLDVASQREVRERKGLAMALGPLGVSVGVRFHALWQSPDKLTRCQHARLVMEDRRGIPGNALRPLMPPNDPAAFHVFASRDAELAPVESLSLGLWTAISGAAFSTGLGRRSDWRLALLAGLANLRLGYWWNTGISSGERPGMYPQSLWRKLKYLPGFIFRMQWLLLAEWRALFAGPSRQYWYLTDGGHFDNTALYELLRRKVEFIIACDATDDAEYRWNDMANLARLARLDFEASINWIARADIEANVPKRILNWIDISKLADFDLIGQPKNGNAAVGRVDFKDGGQSWILLLKPCLCGAEPFDLHNYKANHTDFPQQPTYDQFFDDEQWESYRALGESTGTAVLLPPERQQLIDDLNLSTKRELSPNLKISARRESF